MGDGVSARSGQSFVLEEAKKKKCCMCKRERNPRARERKGVLKKEEKGRIAERKREREKREEREKENKRTKEKGESRRTEKMKKEAITRCLFAMGRSLKSMCLT